MLTIPANFKKTGVLATYGPLKVVLFRNPSGTVVFRVTGTVLQKQVKKNFRTRDEAVANLEPIFKMLTGGMAASDLTELHLVRTSLTHEKVAEAEECFRRLRNLELGLLEAVEIARKSITDTAAIRPNARGYLCTGLIALDFGAEPMRDEKESAEEFKARQTAARIEQALLANGTEAELAVAHFARTMGRRNVQPTTVAVYRYVAADFIRAQNISTIVEITTEKLLTYITRSGVSTRTHKDQRARLYGFCRHLQKAKLLADNPVKDIDPIRQAKVRIEYATVSQVAAALELFARGSLTRGRFKRGAMLPRYLLTAFSPLRPDEVGRLSADWSSFNFETHTVQIVRSKTGTENRTVELDRRLSEVLRECAAQGLSPNFKRRKAWEAWLHQGGVPRGVRDVLRHSYATYSYAVDRNKDDLAQKMNNSVSVLNRHYINTAPRSVEGKAYFDLLDTVGHLLTLPAIQFTKAGDTA